MQKKITFFRFFATKFLHSTYFLLILMLNPEHFVQGCRHSETGYRRAFAACSKILFTFAAASRGLSFFYHLPLRYMKPTIFSLQTLLRDGLVALSLAGSSLLSAQPLTTQYAARLTPPPVYACLYTPEPPQIDGNVDEHVWERAVAISQLHDIQGEGFPKPSLPTEIRMLWDSTYLYVAARLVEPYIEATLATHDDIVWHENDFEVFLDPDGDGLGYFEIEINALGTLLDLQMSQPYRSGGHFFTAWNCPGIRRAVKLEGTLSDSTQRDTAWTIEMAIPHRALAVDFNDALEQSRVWRMNFSRVEWLHRQGPEENWVWAPTGVVDIHMPERWGYVCLVDSLNEPADAVKAETPYRPDDYRFLWLLFYTQKDFYAQHHRYISRLQHFPLAPEDFALLHLDAAHGSAASLPADGRGAEPQVEVSATPRAFELSLRRASLVLVLDQNGYFSVERDE